MKCFDLQCYWLYKREFHCNDFSSKIIQANQSTVILRIVIVFCMKCKYFFKFKFWLLFYNTTTFQVSLWTWQETHWNVEKVLTKWAVLNLLEIQWNATCNNCPVSTAWNNYSMNTTWWDYSVNITCSNCSSKYSMQ